MLADISYILGKRNINIDGVSVDVVGGDAIISLTLKDAQKLHLHCAKAATMFGIRYAVCTGRQCSWRNKFTDFKTFPESGEY